MTVAYHVDRGWRLVCDDGSSPAAPDRSHGGAPENYRDEKRDVESKPITQHSPGRYARLLLAFLLALRKVKWLTALVW